MVEFYFLQGSAATHLKCGRKYGMYLVENLVENARMKDFRKSANINVKVMNEWVMARFFELLCRLWGD